MPLVEWKVACHQQVDEGSEASGDPHVVKIAEMVTNFRIVQDSAEAAERDSHAIRPAKPAKLTTPLEMGFQIDNDTGNPAPFQFAGKFGNDLSEVTEDFGMSAIAPICRHEVLQQIFVDVIGPFHSRFPVVFDVKPANRSFHSQVLLESFYHAVSLADDISTIKNRYHGRMVDLAV